MPWRRRLEFHSARDCVRLGSAKQGKSGCVPLGFTEAQVGVSLYEITRSVAPRAASVFECRFDIM